MKEGIGYVEGCLANEARIEQLENTIKLLRLDLADNAMKLNELQHFKETFEPLVNSLVEGMNDAKKDLEEKKKR